MKKKLAALFASLAAAIALAPAALADVIPYDPNDIPPEVITPEPADVVSPATSSLPVWLLIVAVLIIVAALIVIAAVRKKALQK